MGRFLLQRTGREGGSRSTLHWLCRDILDRKVATFATLQESLCLLYGGETTAELCLHFAAIGIAEDGCDTVILFGTEILYLALTLHDEAHGNALDTTC